MTRYTKSKPTWIHDELARSIAEMGGDGRGKAAVEQLEDVPQTGGGRSSADARWAEMLAYLDDAESGKLVQKGGVPKAKLVDGGHVFTIACFIGALALFLLLPYGLLTQSGMESFPAACWSFGILAATSLVPLWIVVLDKWLPARRRVAESRARVSAWEEAMGERLHDDGDNDLSEIRAIATAVSNIGSNAEAAGKLGRESAELADKMSSFASVVRDYVLLSYWECREKRISAGFDAMVMRASAAFTAYVELASDAELEDEHRETAFQHMETVADQSLKAAYRNFNRVDAKIHGEEHIFDMPDVPRALSNMEKLSIAAAIAADEE